MRAEEDLDMEWSQKKPAQPLIITSSAAFQCVQAWLLEKPAAWAGKDARCLAAAQMAQRPSTKRPCDALLTAERSHQRRRIQLLDEQLDGALVEVRRLARRLAYELEDLQHLQEVLEEVCRHLYGSSHPGHARTAGRACPALVQEQYHVVRAVGKLESQR